MWTNPQIIMEPLANHIITDFSHSVFLVILEKNNGEIIVNNRKITSYYLLLNMPLRNFNDPLWLKTN